MGGMFSEIGVAKFLPDYLRHVFSPTVHTVVQHMKKLLCGQERQDLLISY